MKNVLALGILMSVLLSVNVRAQDTNEEPQFDETKEAEIAQKVKKRLYPGGRDESDLKVQSQLTTPARKFAPQTEIQAESAESEAGE
jgi:hypothetical protein